MNKTFTLVLTEQEASAVGFACGRYEWATALADLYRHDDDDGNAVYSGTESAWWEVIAAVEADTEGDHEPYPMAALDLAGKIQAFLDQFI